LANSQAVSVPSFFAPALTSITAAGRKYAQVNSSSRVHATLTGFPVAFASRAASIAVSTLCFPP
jgi:hypothetical protein